jgi:hypothetical protein
MTNVKLLNTTALYLLLIFRLYLHSTGLSRVGVRRIRGRCSVLREEAVAMKAKI